MCEYAGRYDHFARFLAEHGFAVYMNEHAGHGRCAQTLGYFADEDGMDFVVRDMLSLDEVIRAEQPGVPVFLLGHSMGSFLARKYITTHGGTLSGCLLSGTAGSNPLLFLGRGIAAAQKRLLGPKSQGRLLSALTFGSFTKRIKHPVNHRAWLSREDSVCKDFQVDYLCGFHFTASGFADLYGLTREVNLPGWAGQVPKDLPIYLFAGAEDPVGNYGKGVQEVYQRLKQAGVADVSVTLYPGARHETLNETNRDEVYADTLAWLEAHLDRERSTE
jgi:alpha-beta hydrolase superfamily lysophospholipase